MATNFEIDGKTYFIKKITPEDTAKGRKVYLSAFKNAVEGGAILQSALKEHMRRQGTWDDAKEQQYTDLIKRSGEIEYQIKSGQLKKASQAKEKALELKKLRDDISSLLSVQNESSSLTAEGIAKNEEFNFYLSVCLCDYVTQKPVYSSVDDYIRNSNTELAQLLASKFASAFYGIDDDYEKSFLENRVLRKLNLLDEDGHLLNADGRRVDLEGNLVDENGARIDINGNRIDINNNPVIDDDVIDTLEFENDLVQEFETVAGKVVTEVPEKKKKSRS